MSSGYTYVYWSLIFVLCPHTTVFMGGVCILICTYGRVGHLLGEKYFTIEGLKISSLIEKTGKGCIFLIEKRPWRKLTRERRD